MSEDGARAQWLVRCSCGWTTTLSAEWAAQSAAKIHASLGWTAKEHAVTVEPPHDAKDQDQASLWDQDQDSER